MKNYFGVMSTTPSNKKLKNGYTIYDWVVRQKCFPAFWGRTILGKDPISIEEIGFLKEKNCKIMCSNVVFGNAFNKCFTVDIGFCI